MKLTNEQIYKALCESDTHWLEDCVLATEENWRRADYTGTKCAMCQLCEVGCVGCPLKCSSLWNAVRDSSNYTQFHTASLAMHAKIRKLRDEYAEKVASKAKQREPRKDEIWWCEGKSVTGADVKGWGTVTDRDVETSVFKNCVEVSIGNVGWKYWLPLDVLKYQRRDAIPEPKKPEFRAGDIIAAEKKESSEVGMIYEISDDTEHPFTVHKAHGHENAFGPRHAVPATPSQIKTFMDEKYTVELDGVRCRFYETESGALKHLYTGVTGGKYDCTYTDTDCIVQRELLTAASMPIMPWKLCLKHQNGEFWYPLEVK